jgi:hypothetical protein
MIPANHSATPSIRQRATASLFNVFNRMKTAVMGTQVRLKNSDKITLVKQNDGPGDSYRIFYVNDKPDRHVQIMVNGMNNILSEDIIARLMIPYKDINYVTTKTVKVEDLAVSMGNGINAATISVIYLDTKELVDTDKLEMLEYLDTEFVGVNNTQVIQHIQIIDKNSGVKILNASFTLLRALKEIQTDENPSVEVSAILKYIKDRNHTGDLKIVCEVRSNMRQGGRKTRRNRR